MAKDRFEDCHACMNAVIGQLRGHSPAIMKVVLLALLRDVLVAESSSSEMLGTRADQVADFIRTGGH